MNKKENHYGIYLYKVSDSNNHIYGYTKTPLNIYLSKSTRHLCKFDFHIIKSQNDNIEIKKNNFCIVVDHIDFEVYYFN